MHKLIEEMRRYDRQLVLHFYKPSERWVIYRRPERHGAPPTDLANHEIRHHLIHGALLNVMTVEDEDGGYREPGFWLIDELRRRDARRRNLEQEVREMDHFNEKLRERAEEEASERLSYRIKQDWPRIRDELRGDTGHRKTV